MFSDGHVATFLWPYSVASARRIVDFGDNKQYFFLTRDFRTMQTNIIYDGRCTGLAKKLTLFQCNQFPYSFALKVLYEAEGKKEES